MSGSIKLFTWLRIPVYLHWSFAIIPLLLVGNAFRHQTGWEMVLLQMTLFALFFACVMLHEYGHSLAARRFGVETQDIILTPIGGIARLERMPERPVQELIVAIAGPMVNVVIASVLFLLCYYFVFSGESYSWIFEEYTRTMFQFSAEENGVLSDPEVRIPGWMEALLDLLTVNILMVLFNMIPAFPMDGGRVLRALLAMQFGRSRATTYASLAGQAIAVVFILIGISDLSSYFSLILIGVFVFITARSENTMVQMDTMLQRFRASDLIRTQFTRLQVNDWMQTPIELIQHGLERHFLVFDMEDQLRGILLEKDIIKAMKKNESSRSVQEIALAYVERFHRNESLRTIYYTIQQDTSPLVAVMSEKGEVEGVIDASGLQHFLRLQKIV